MCVVAVVIFKSIDPATVKSTSEKGMITRVVKDLIGPFSDFNHVV